MKTYRFTIRNQNWEKIEKTYSAQSEKVIEKMAQEWGWYIEGPIEETQHIDTPIERISNWLGETFSRPYRYSRKIELILLKSFAVSLKRGFSEKWAIENMKYSFGPSEKAIRGQVDQFLKTSEGSNISHISDVFLYHEEMFSEETLILLKQSQGASVQLHKILSNPVASDQKWHEIEWYVEMTQEIEKLTTSLRSAIVPEILKFTWLMWAIMLVLLWLVPSLLEAASKSRDISNDNYFYVWEITIATSKFLSEYWFYILFALIVWVWCFIFFYRTNFFFRKWFHRYMLNMYIIWDIISLMYTKKITSLMAIYQESWMKWEKIIDHILPIIPLIPIKEELEYIRDRIWSQYLDVIFSEYPEEEKCFTELFYVQLWKESSAEWEMTWRYGQAFASILLNTEDMWEQSVKTYPKKIGKIISISSLMITGFFTMGLLIIIWFSSLYSV